MIKKLVRDIATQLEVPLPKISITDGRRLGCRDMDLLTLEFDCKEANSLIGQSDMDQLHNGICSDRDRKSVV